MMKKVSAESFWDSNLTPSISHTQSRTWGARTAITMKIADAPAKPASSPTDAAGKPFSEGFREPV
jgi:hypothetical protein